MESSDAPAVLGPHQKAFVGREASTSDHEGEDAPLLAHGNPDQARAPVGT